MHVHDVPMLLRTYCVPCIGLLARQQLPHCNPHRPISRKQIIDRPTYDWMLLPMSGRKSKSHPT